MRSAACATLFVAVAALCGRAGDLPVEAAKPLLTDSQKAHALGAIKSHEAKRRSDTYKAFHRLGRGGKEEYLEVLEQAREFHAAAFSSRAIKLTVEKNSLSQFEEFYSEWQASSSAAYQMVQTNWKDAEPGDYHEKHAEMDRLFVAASAAFERLVRHTPRVGKQELSGLSAFPEIIQELDVEVAWARDELVIVAGPADLLSALKSAGEVHLCAILESVARFRQVLADAEAIAKHNESSSWAIAVQKDFAALLNGRRVVLGQSALRLDEKLSKACLGHSAEMEQLGYFAHESPTPANRSPGMRAKRAAFEGNFAGECIFAGSSSPAGAHQAWWYSDGHRTIMYAPHPDTLGLGPAGKLWTLNTGKRRGE